MKTILVVTMALSILVLSGCFNGKNIVNPDLQSTFENQNDNNIAEKEWKALHGEGTKLFDSEKYQEAVKYLEQAVEKAISIYGEEHINTSQSMLILAKTYNVLGKRSDTERLMLKVLTFREEKYGEDSILVGDILTNLGWLYNSYEDFDKAEALFMRALGIYETSLGKENFALISVLDGLANACKKRGNLKKCEELLKRALGISKNSSPIDNKQVADLYCSFAELAFEQGLYGDAEKYFKMALEMQKRIFGDNNQQKRYAEAEPLYCRIIKIDERTLGPVHKKIGDCKLNLGIIYFYLDRHADAEKCFKQTLEIEESLYGKDSPDLISTLSQLVLFYKKIQNTGQAESFQGRINCIKEKHRLQ